jgi:hypothetical protein
LGHVYQAVFSVGDHTLNVSYHRGSETENIFGTVLVITRTMLPNIMTHLTQKLLDTHC